MTDTANAAVASIVIPIHNEAVILEGAVREFSKAIEIDPE